MLKCADFIFYKRGSNSLPLFLKEDSVHLFLAPFQPHGEAYKLDLSTKSSFLAQYVHWWTEEYMNLYFQCKKWFHVKFLLHVISIVMTFQLYRIAVWIYLPFYTWVYFLLVLFHEALVWCRYFYLHLLFHTVVTLYIHIYTQSIYVAPGTVCIHRSSPA